MNEDLNLIVPTQEIAFAVKKDGSVITNFSEDGEFKPVRVLKVFECLNEYLEKCDNSEVSAFALAHIITGPTLQKLILKRMEERD